MATDTPAVSNSNSNPKPATRYSIIVDGGVPADLVDRVSRLHAAALMAKSCDPHREKSRGKRNEASRR